MESATFIDFLGHREVPTSKFLRAVAAEFLATAILIVSGCGSVVTMNEGDSVSTLTSALTFGMTVAMIVWTFNHVSGAHINPVVTLSFLVTGRGTVAKTIAYTIAQCAGAIAGATILWLLLPEAWRGTLGSTVFAEGVSLWQGFAIEVISTFFLLLGVFASSDRLRTDHGGSMPLTIGLVVFMQSAWAGKPTGCSMNPARTLGPALVSNTWDHHWVYWAAPSFGGVLGALVYEFLFAERLITGNSALQANDLAMELSQSGEKLVSTDAVSNKDLEARNGGDARHSAHLGE